MTAGKLGYSCEYCNSRFLREDDADVLKDSNGVARHTVCGNELKPCPEPPIGDCD